MSVPEHLWRFPTWEAIDSLARRFSLPNTPHMQDWEWEVADPERLDEFLSAYSSGDLSDDERFTIMETILQCFEESDTDLSSDARWSRLLAQLDEHVDLHAYTVWYWSCLEEQDPTDWFRVTPFIRQVLARHRDRLEGPCGAA
jgi:hypothetical protein